MKNQIPSAIIRKIAKRPVAIAYAAETHSDNKPFRFFLQQLKEIRDNIAVMLENKKFRWITIGVILFDIVFLNLLFLAR